MLAPTQIASADECVKFFYQELVKTPRNFNGKSIFDRDYIEGMFGKDYSWILAPHRDKIAEYSTKEKYAEFRSTLTEKERQALLACERLAAETGGVDKLGIQRLIRRVPVIFYHFLSPNVSYDDETPPEQYEIGLSPQSLKSWTWCHDFGRSVAVSWHNGGLHKIAYPHFEISSFISGHFSAQVRSDFTGLLYHGLTLDEEEQLLLLVDTSEATGQIEKNQSIANKCQNARRRYGIDKLYLLSASVHTNSQRDCEKDMPVSSKARLDACDRRYTNLEIKAIQEILKQSESETLWRILLLNTLGKGGFSNVDDDPGQTLRELLKDHAYGMAGIRASKE